MKYNHTDLRCRFVVCFLSLVPAFLLFAAASIAFASLTFTGTNISSDSGLVIDSAGTIWIGTSTATSIVIGNTNSTTSFTGNVGIGTTNPGSNLDIQGNLSRAVLGSELLSDTTGAICSGSGACVTKSVSVTSGVAYQVSWSEQHSPANNGNVTPALGTATGLAVSQEQTTVQPEREVITANTSGTMNLVFTVSGFTSGTITLSVISLKAITPSNPVARILNSDGTEGFSLRSGGSARYNTFVGLGAGALAYNGTDNVALGNQALANTTGGTFNTAVGYQTLYNNTTGPHNTAVGNGALFYNTTANSNTAIGEGALYYNTTGNQNDAFGIDTLYSNTTGLFNVGMGAGSLYSNTAGLYNTALGNGALYAVTSGSGNTGSGYAAGNKINTGNYNTVVGFEAGNNLTTGSNNIVIGTYNNYAPAVDSSNTLNIGNLIYGTGLNGTQNTPSTGNVGIGTSTPATSLQIDTVSSTLRLGGSDHLTSCLEMQDMATTSQLIDYVYVSSTTLVSTTTKPSFCQ